MERDASRGRRDPGRDGDEFASDGGRGRLGQAVSRDGRRGPGEVEGHHGQDQPGGIRGEHARGQVCQGAVLQVSVDEFDDRLAAVDVELRGSAGIKGVADEADTRLLAALKVVESEFEA